MAVKLLRGWGAPHADSGCPTCLGADVGIAMVAEPPLWEAVALPWWSGCLASPLNAPRPSGYPPPGSPQTGLCCPCSEAHQDLHESQPQQDTARPAQGWAVPGNTPPHHSRARGPGVKLTGLGPSCPGVLRCPGWGWRLPRLWSFPSLRRILC